MEDRRADNGLYNLHNRYSVIFITKDADSEIPDRLMEAFPNVSFDRSYISENLYHDVFTVWWEEVPSSTSGTVGDHRLLTGRDEKDQHPISAISGLQSQLDRPPAVERITNEDLEVMLQ